MTDIAWTARPRTAGKRVDFVRLATWAGVLVGCGAFWTVVIRAFV